MFSVIRCYASLEIIIILMPFLHYCIILTKRIACYEFATLLKYQIIDNNEELFSNDVQTNTKTIRYASMNIHEHTFSIYVNRLKGIDIDL